MPGKSINPYSLVFLQVLCIILLCLHVMMDIGNGEYISAACDVSLIAYLFFWMARTQGRVMAEI